MLRPIPARIMAHTVTIEKTVGVDVWQNAYTENVEIHGVCVQPASDTRKGKDNTEVTLASVLFADTHSTHPAIDWASEKEAAEKSGHTLSVVYNGRHYTVVSVDSLVDDFGALHHWEVGLA